MEIGQIEAFLAVVSEGSFTRAAERLNLTQPSLASRSSPPIIAGQLHTPEAKAEAKAAG
jgi:hypothetical protein